VSLVIDFLKLLLLLLLDVLLLLMDDLKYKLITK